MSSSEDLWDTLYSLKLDTTTTNLPHPHAKLLNLAAFSCHCVIHWGNYWGAASPQWLWSVISDHRHMALCRITSDPLAFFTVYCRFFIEKESLFLFILLSVVITNYQQLTRVLLPIIGPTYFSIHRQAWCSSCLISSVLPPQVNSIWLLWLFLARIFYIWINFVIVIDFF